MSCTPRARPDRAALAALAARLDEVRDWIAAELEHAPQRATPRVPRIEATDDERAFAEQELRAMRTPKGRRR